MTSSTVVAMIVTIIGAVMFVIGTVLAWIYVDWKYVKEKE
jgi:TRAP-type mannitol/chloroaromatic compound transport system permease small subunit